MLRILLLLASRRPCHIEKCSVPKNQGYDQKVEESSVRAFYTVDLEMILSSYKYK